ncbi:helix-hairpin-helix domain-containing protein [Halalkalicoccus jeotgali]|uniref:Helix-hairpin-helix domain-containing protein n=1 Tax=Halalkalicoccus jeotgali (strain DSM 18796 / CECT 7217 / JCM 14584 / KCTC 4019 / B3) TaxID=795797 RepID=D8J6W3_HALJB|nr:helix-hairpin-helix domain-containing protein [Halalkalicoccus jeotgali]ADJ15916.1 hypothetical protein HacjB3_12675 [Halalkalicoccus jeotgali B3]ELY38012.1 hypothetical protein C497_07879 [Halalkalicoccus jeotgali B3]
MALLNKLKSLLGLDDGQSGSDRQGTDDVGVTVERDSGASAGKPAEESPPSTPAPGSEDAEPEPADGSKSDPEPEAGTEPAAGTDVEAEIESPSPATGTDDVEEHSEGQEGPLIDSESEPMETVESEPVDETGTETEDADRDSHTGTDAAGPEAAEQEALREIKGIGPSYATKLSEAGVDSVADLAAADAGELSSATGLSEKRIQGWIDRAQAR